LQEILFCDAKLVLFRPLSLDGTTFFVKTFDFFLPKDSFGQFKVVVVIKCLPFAAVFNYRTVVFQLFCDVIKLASTDVKFFCQLNWRSGIFLFNNLMDVNQTGDS